jgi:hypothetical protein
MSAESDSSPAESNNNLQVADCRAVPLRAARALPRPLASMFQKSVNFLLSGGFWLGYLALLHGLASFVACPFPLCLSEESSETLRIKTTKIQRPEGTNSEQIYRRNVDWRKANLQ